eukprot:scaffold26650_cov63-Phaeocystis_antarctica.AAC.4
MPAPRRGGTAVAIFWSPFCYLPEYLPPHVMTVHECYEVESYYRGLLMPFVMVPLSVAGFLFVGARFMLEPGFMRTTPTPRPRRTRALLGAPRSSCTVRAIQTSLRSPTASSTNSSS